MCVYKPVHQPSQLKLSLGQVLFDPLVSKNANCEPHNSNPLSKGLFDLRRLIWRMHLKARNYRLDATNVMTLCLRLCVCVWYAWWIYDGYMQAAAGRSRQPGREPHDPGRNAIHQGSRTLDRKGVSESSQQRQYCQCMFQRSLTISSFNTLSVSI